MAKQIYRLQSSKMVGGVCAGLADYLDIDSTLIRLLFVAVGLVTALFPMFLFYIIAWAIMPIKDEVEEKVKEDEERR